MKKQVGSPHNYGPTPEELAEVTEKEAKGKVRECDLMLEYDSPQHPQADQAAKVAREDAGKREKEAKDLAVKQSDWSKKLIEVKHQEQETLEAASLPLRTYLMKHIMPTLTAGLLEVCKARPDDPVDCLAEYLFKLNPQID